jgi:hypothetical protein
MKKNLQQSISNETFATSTDTQSTKKEKFIDTTKTESGKIIIIEIEFYRPTPNDTANQHQPATNAGGVEMPNIGNIKNAAIKSIKQTTIEQGMEQKGQSKETSETTGEQSAVFVSNGNQHTKEVIAPAPDPYRWRYIFYILALVTVALLYLKRVPVLNWIKAILSNIRHVFVK